jgi:hypothetical protein
MEIEGRIGARVVVVVEPEGFAVPFENWEAFQEECFKLPYATEVAGPEVNGAWAITFTNIPWTIPDNTIIRWSKHVLSKYLKPTGGETA